MGCNNFYDFRSSSEIILPDDNTDNLPPCNPNRAKPAAAEEWVPRRSGSYESESKTKTIPESRSFLGSLSNFIFPSSSGRRAEELSEHGDLLRKLGDREEENRKLREQLDEEKQNQYRRRLGY